MILHAPSFEETSWRPHAQRTISSEYVLSSLIQSCICVCSCFCLLSVCRTVQLAKKLCGTKGLKYCSDERIKDFQDIEVFPLGILGPVFNVNQTKITNLL
jgi:hypothetical protein